MFRDCVRHEMPLSARGNRSSSTFIEISALQKTWSNAYFILNNKTKSSSHILSMSLQLIFWHWEVNREFCFCFFLSQHSMSWNNWQSRMLKQWVNYLHWSPWRSLKNLAGIQKPEIGWVKGKIDLSCSFLSKRLPPFVVASESEFSCLAHWEVLKALTNTQ